jgi:hypothetical protein
MEVLRTSSETLELMVLVRNARARPPAAAADRRSAAPAPIRETTRAVAVDTVGASTLTPRILALSTSLATNLGTY